MKDLIMRKKPTSSDVTKTGPSAVLRNLSSAIEQRLGPIEYRPLADVIPYAGNPRAHPEKQIVQLMASICEFGFPMPLLVDVTGELICGHARHEAAKRLGLEQVPVLVAQFWSKAQIKAYRLADNQLASAASWDENLLRIELTGIIELDEVPIEVLGWETGQIDVILDGASLAEDDAADVIPEAPSDPVTRLDDIWVMGKHRLSCGSSLEAECWSKLMAGKMGALSLNDPPWNVPVNGHVSSTGRHQEFAMASGEMTPEQFVEFNANWFAKSCAHLKDGALVMAFMDHAHLFELMTAARQARLKHLNLCVWAKTNGGMGSLYRSQHELVLVLKHGSAPHTNMVELGRHGRYRTNLWLCAGANVFGATRDADLAAHPTVKPVALLAEAIRDVTRHGEIVTDAFSGSGSTILACERTKRVGYAIEIEPRYVDVGVYRWEKMTGRQAVLEATGQTFSEVAAERSVALPVAA
ncbi:site-specific DNA-methyltransferase [Sphingomonas sp. M1-B02]|uniref:site-specific DNA-methyltransferase n=1 Tax=Sphingomonas sp. M1-B02 TaxID=3114300 RepID=UPI00223F1B4D|nr:DNA methyltransferase [Sphingomonas sp. S6-11]UZK65408.1 site-specific DNA-methyltransferase [Sphingomonas sp. S6-11]